MKLCVIGAGAAGLCAIRQAIKFKCEVIAFEQTNQIGGTWVYTDEVGKDKHGLDIHTSRYQGLHTNLPKEIMGYPDFPFPEQDKSYIDAEDVLSFYKLYSENFDLEKYVKFEHHVVMVRPLWNETWEVTVKNLQNETHETYIFDSVLVCNGHYSFPNVPNYEGQDIFKGKQIHSHDYRCPEPFKNDRVLVIGAGPSGFDAAVDISKVAEAVTWSHHFEKSLVTHFSDNVHQKPDVQKFTKDGAIFVDGSFETFSKIVYCTGYKYTFPFLSVDCEITCDENYVTPLYKHCVSIKKNTLFFIGLPNYILPNQMFDLQVRFCLKFLTGQKKLPTKKEMLEDAQDDLNKRLEKGLPKSKAHMMGPEFQEAYYNSLAAIADIEPIKPVMLKMFAKGLCNLFHDSTNFRNENFKILDDENYELISPQ